VQQQLNYIHFIIIYSFAGFLAYLIFFFVLYFTGGNPLGQLSSLNNGSLIICVIAAIVHLRIASEHMSFFSGFKTGLFTALVISALTSIFIYIFVEYYGAAMLQEYLKQTLAILENSKGEIEKSGGKIAYQETYKSLLQLSPSDIALDNIYKKSIMGLFFSFIISLIARKPLIKTT